MGTLLLPSFKSAYSNNPSNRPNDNPDINESHIEKVKPPAKFGERSLHKQTCTKITSKGHLLYQIISIDPEQEIVQRIFSLFQREPKKNTKTILQHIRVRHTLTSGLDSNALTKSFSNLEQQEDCITSAN